MFDRDTRSARDDHFGWHPATGPDVDERDGHVFEGNLLVAGEGFDKPLLRFDQPPALCGKVTTPATTRVVGGSTCQTGYASLEAFRKATKLEPRGQAWIAYPGTVFRSVELRHFELAQSLPGLKEVPVSEEARKVLGWSAPTHVPGAYAAPQ